MMKQVERVDCRGNDPLFHDFDGYSRISDALVHLRPREYEGCGAMLCGLVLRYAWNRFPGIHRGKMFGICKVCLEIAKVRSKVN